MIDYNDGMWHGWNGGECPVDPESTVQVAFVDTHAPGMMVDRAKTWTWAHFGCKSDIAAFRVTEPSPPKPREWWAVGLHMHNDEATARTFLDQLNDAHPEMDFGPIIHVREVLPE